MTRTTRYWRRAAMRCSILFWRAAVFALIWWILTGGEPGSWLIGGVVIVLATLTSLSLLPKIPFSTLGFIRFVPFFLWRSFKGGIDVARCALHPRLPLAPSLREYTFRLPKGPARVFMANTVTLLPGTLSVDVGDAGLLVHMLDETRPFDTELDAVERRVADLFGLALREDLRAGKGAVPASDGASENRQPKGDVPT